MQASCVAVAQAGAKQARKPSKPRTRDRILTESLALFAAQGFEGTDIVEIEEAVGLTPGSGGFYRHFKNKEDVLRAAVNAEIARVREHYRALGSTAEPPEPASAVGHRVEVMLEMLWQMRDLMAVVAHDNDRFPDLLPTVGSVMNDCGVAFDAEDLGSLLDQQSVPERPPEVLAAIITMAGVGFTLTESLFGRPISNIDRQQFGRVLTDLVLCRRST
jgi:AcrR family transcriptional regulator